MSTDYSAYIGHNSKESLLEITKLAEAAHAAQLTVERLELELKAAQNKLRELAEKELPAKMDELGISNFETSSGITVAVTEKIRASLAAENKPKGYEWLESNGFGGMIKSNVVVNFGRTQLEEANKLVEELRDASRVANLERKVEPSTLTAFVKEQLTQGKDIPLDIFGVFRQRIAKIEITNGGRHVE